MDACDALDTFAADAELAGRLVHREVLPARPAPSQISSHPYRKRLPTAIARAASTVSTRTKPRRSTSCARARASSSSTGTASGKSLCYQVPIVESVVADRRDTALLVFPTKALAHDQLRALRSWLVPGMRAVTFDGDTNTDDRAWARKNANVVLTNPDMLHVGILPSHQRWATFMMRLRYVVIDELHTQRGIFGSHVAHVLRRLRRVCEHYGSSPTFCFASATIGNPGELASELCGLPVEQIDHDGSPRSERVLACWQRPLLDEHSGARGSANVETAELLVAVRPRRSPDARVHAQPPWRGARRAVRAGAPRRSASSGSARASPRTGPVTSRRSGATLEPELTSGRMLGIAATNALELGIDVGGLDAVVLNGFPGTLASMWQQAGRAGRTDRRAAAVLIAGDDQLDQWYVAHPAELTGRAPERAVVNPQNPFVLRAQVACAAHELPISPDDARWFGEGLDEAVRELVQADLLTPRGGRMYWSGPSAPAAGVGLRTGSSVEYQLIDLHEERTIGTVDDARVFAVAHPGRRVPAPGPAVPGRSSRHTRSPRRAGAVRRRRVHDAAHGDGYRDRRRRAAARRVGESIVHLGAVEVRSNVIAYQRKQISTNRVIEVCDLDLPERALVTRACWYTVPAEAIERAGIAPGRLLGTVHAAEHGLIGMLPLFTICDRWDVGGVSMAQHPQTGEPTIFVYDGYPGGAGIAELAFDAAARHVRATLDLVAACACDDGCPSCVQSPKCGNWNEYLDKGGAITLLGLMARAPVRG